MALCALEVCVRVHLVAERPHGEGRQLPRVAVRERDDDAVRVQGLEPLDRVRNEARLELLPVGDHRRAGRLELGDGLYERLLAQRLQLAVGDPSLRGTAHARDQLRWPGDAPDRLGRNRHARMLAVRDHDRQAVLATLFGEVIPHPGEEERRSPSVGSTMVDGTRIGCDRRLRKENSRCPCCRVTLAH